MYGDIYKKVNKKKVKQSKLIKNNILEIIKHC